MPSFGVRKKAVEIAFVFVDLTVVVSLPGGLQMETTAAKAGFSSGWVATWRQHDFNQTLHHC